MTAERTADLSARIGEPLGAHQPAEHQPLW